MTGGIPRPPFLGIRLDDPVHLYVFCAVMLVGSLLIMRHLLQTPFGFSLRMIRDNPNRCGFLGIRVWRVKLLAFVVAGIFGSIGGLIMSLYISSAYPDFAYWTMSGEAIFMILLGGMTVFRTVGWSCDATSSDRCHIKYSCAQGIQHVSPRSHYPSVCIGFTEGILGSVYEWWADRRRPDSTANPEAHASGSHH